MVSPLVAGSLISAGGSILGGLLGGRSAKKAQAAANAANKEALQHGIRWRVNDAKAAGIHPLAALGANVAGPYATAAGSGHLGDAVAGGAQAMGDAVSSRPTPEAQENALLQNDLLRAQVEQSKASTADLLASAQSRSLIAGLRAQSVGGASATSNDLSYGNLVQLHGPTAANAALFGKTIYDGSQIARRKIRTRFPPSSSRSGNPFRNLPRRFPERRY